MTKLHIDFTHPHAADIDQIYEDFFIFAGEEFDDPRQIQQMLDGMISLAQMGWDRWTWYHEESPEQTGPRLYAAQVDSHTIHFGSMQTSQADPMVTLQSLFRRARQFDLCEHHSYPRITVQTEDPPVCRRCGYPGPQPELFRIRESVETVILSASKSDMRLRALETLLELIQRFATNQNFDADQRLRLITNTLNDEDLLDRRFDNPMETAEHAIRDLLHMVPQHWQYEDLLAQLDNLFSQGEETDA